MNYAYITLVTQKKFLQGAKFLLSSLKRVNSKYPLYIIITDNIFFDIYQDIPEDMNYLLVPYFYFKNGTVPQYRDTINKLHIFNLNFSKMLFLDSDLYILNNIDYLFDKYNSDFTKIVYVETLGPRKQKNDICANCFLVNKKIKIDLKEISESFYQDDEDVLNELLKNTNSEIFEDNDILKNMYHDYGIVKYWELINLSPKFFAMFSNEEILLFFNLIFSYKRNLGVF